MKERKHGLSETQAVALLNLLWDCANAPPNHNLPDEPPDHHHQHAVDQLKAADVWQGTRLTSVYTLELFNTALHSITSR